VGKTIRALLGRWGGKEGCFEFCYIFCFCNIRGLRAGRICLGMGICALRFRFYFMISQFILGFSLIAGGGGVESLILAFPVTALLLCYFCSTTGLFCWSNKQSHGE
jgi:hypothetical protein